VSTYTRERSRLTAADVKRALALVNGGKVTGRGIDHADVAVPGLILRTTPLAVTWLLKTRTSTIRLGAGADVTVAAAREAATRARLDLKGGVDPRPDLRVFEHAMKTGASVEDAVDAAFPESVEAQSDEDRRRRGPWQWQDLVEEFLAHKLPQLRPRWARQFEGHLRRSLDPRLTRAPVSAVRPDDLLALRDRVAEERTQSAAADTVEACKAALDWALSLHSHRAGFSHSTYPWWRDKVRVDYQAKARKHTPRLDELARTLFVAERHRALGGTGKRTSDAVLGALWATVLTGQRVTALTGTRRASVVPWEGGPPGWVVWSWSGEEMKKSGGEEVPHGLPIPPAAAAAIARWDTSPGSEFLFPSTVAGQPLAGNALTQLAARLQGKSKAGRDGNVTLRPEADLFALHRIRPWVRHDVRRTLSAYLDMERLGGSASAILGHRKQRTPGEHAQERELAEAITLRHYLHGQRLEMKAAGMEAWTKAVLDAYEAEHSRLA
jgi:Arm DNA-binding domain